MSLTHVFYGKGKALLRTTICFSCLVFIPSLSWGQVKLNTWTNPSSGQAGTTNVNLTGSGFPSGTIPPGNVTITVAATCGGPALATTTGLKVTKLIGTSDRVEFLIPASLAQDTYDVSLTGTTSGGTKFSSTNCSLMKVLPPKTVLSSCVPSSSLGVLLPPKGTGNVTVYVPNGAWATSNTGIGVVPLEGSGTPATISTPNAPNSCASNSATGESVCVANNTDVYLITGSSLNTTLPSGSNAFANFSGGSCENCGVTINSSINEAVITMGLSGFPSGIQFLNLASNTFGTPIGTSNQVSENVQWDPTRNFILSPDEGGVYDLFNTTSLVSPAEYANNIGGGFLDSAGEDCTTGIALSTNEATSELFITDLTQASFKSGSPGSWTAPGQFVSFPEFGEFAAGTSGISVAPGSHLAITTGEFGGNQFAVVTLPSSSGSGTPAFGDYAAAALPVTPDGQTWQQGLDPHTITAYVSPNNGRSYGVMANGDFVPPTWLAVIDLEALLSAPRKAGIYPSGDSCPSCTHSVDPSYNLVTNGVVRYVAVP